MVMLVGEVYGCGWRVLRARRFSEVKKVLVVAITS
jgi:hypothetical protein